LDLSGDIHHYARYWGHNTQNFKDDKFSSNNYASVVAGGGGAYLHPTETLIDNQEVEKKNEQGKYVKQKVRGEIPPQKIYPNEVEPRNELAIKLFDSQNIKEGGYVHWVGMIISVIIFFCLIQFSNVRNLFVSINGFNTVRALPSKAISYFNNENTDLKEGFVLILVIFLLGCSAYKINGLVKKLNDKISKGNIKPDTFNGRVLQLLITSAFFFIGIAVYLFFFLPGLLSYFKDRSTDSYASSVFLLLHFIIAGLLIWLSAEYTNWLPLRTRISRFYEEKTIFQQMKDPNDETKNPIKKLFGKLSRKYSLEYIPANSSVVLAVSCLIFGISVYGKGSLLKIGADLLISIALFGVFGALLFFAYKVGGYTQKSTKKKLLFASSIGLWHTGLQLLTSLILVCYSDALTASVVFVLSILFNSHLGKSLMSKRKRPLLVSVWIIYGLIFLILPVIVRLYFKSKSLYELIAGYGIGDDCPLDWRILLILIIVGYIGWRMSRAWFSWYVAVSLSFDFHNNEAGGAARIEGFKHILRIKVEKEKLTVYVIGFDNAEPELKNLDLKLVDKFVLGSHSLS
jgi:hypothetical protein